MESTSATPLAGRHKTFRDLNEDWHFFLNSRSTDSGYLAKAFVPGMMEAGLGRSSTSKARTAKAAVEARPALDAKGGAPRSQVARGGSAIGITVNDINRGSWIRSVTWSHRASPPSTAREGRGSLSDQAPDARVDERQGLRVPVLAACQREQGVRINVVVARHVG